MRSRVLATGAFLIFAVIAFCGAGPGHAGPFNSFGLLFLFLAVVVWRNWGIIAGDFSAPLFDGLNEHGHDSHYRGGNDNYRRDGQRHYREPDEDH